MTVKGPCKAILFLLLAVPVLYSLNLVWEIIKLLRDIAFEVGDTVKELWNE